MFLVQNAKRKRKYLRTKFRERTVARKLGIEIRRSAYCTIIMKNELKK